MKFNQTLLGGLLLLLSGTFLHAGSSTAASPGIRKIEDITIYRNDDFYSSFPSIIRRPDGELLVAFRRAPDRRKLGNGENSHTNPNSYLVSVRSKDSGKTWTPEPQLLYAHPFGGSQDPCMVQLSDNSILCTSYGWALLASNQVNNLKAPVGARPPTPIGQYVSMGGYILRSVDGGHSWQPPIIPPRPEGVTSFGIFGEPRPALNRGALCEGKDGRLYWAVTSSGSLAMFISADKGLTWTEGGLIKANSEVSFNETSVYETPKGDIVAFIRTAGYNDHLVVARSTDKGKTFTWKDGGIQGHPYHAVRLPDKRVLLVYGYRHKPYGIRARVLDAECTDVASVPEVILRDDGGGGDLGYPWATVLSKKRALVVYYFNKANGTRTIESTLVEIQ